MHPFPHHYTVNASVRPDGDVPLSAEGVRIIESSPPKIFDQAAIDAVMSGKFDTSKLTDKTARHARVRLSFKPN